MVAAGVPGRRWRIPPQVADLNTHSTRSRARACYTSLVRRLIINADDFGMTSGVNRAIVEAHDNGIVTSATLMANSRAFNGAVEATRNWTEEKERFSVGCHVVLLDGEPLLSGQSIPSLLTSRNCSLRFREQLSSFAVAALSGKLNPDEVEAEASAQMRRIQQAGITLSHCDAHKHAHMFPAVLKPLLRAAKACGVPAVRNPFGRLLPLPLRRILGNSKLWKRFAEMSILRSFAVGFRREVANHGLRTPDGSFGVLVTGALTLNLFLEIAAAIPEGTWEFVCHPGYNDADLGQVRTRLRASREQELRVLTSPEAKEALQRRGVQRISYHEL
jgi:chitin disaccharide deacetylase